MVLHDGDHNNLSGVGNRVRGLCVGAGGGGQCQIGIAGEFGCRGANGDRRADSASLEPGGQQRPASSGRCKSCQSARPLILPGLVFGARCVEASGMVRGILRHPNQEVVRQ